MAQLKHKNVNATSGTSVTLFPDTDTDSKRLMSIMISADVADEISVKIGASTIIGPIYFGDTTTGYIAIPDTGIPIPVGQAVTIAKTGVTKLTVFATYYEGK